MKRYCKKWLSLALALIFALGMIPFTALPARAEGGYTLTLEPNYPDAEARVYNDVTEQELLNVMNRVCYDLVGWAETPDGDPVYYMGDTVTLTGDKTLYAIWRAKATSKIGDNDPVDGGIVYVNGIRWRVIGAGENSELLISENNLGEAVNQTNARAYCDTVYGEFSSLEQAAVRWTTKSDVSISIFRPISLSGAKLFLFSAAEAVTYFEESADRLPGTWWLRSLTNNNTNRGGIVNNSGNIVFALVDDQAACARPAFQLNMNKVLFTSAAEGGKVGNGALSRIEDETAADKKLTLLDPSRAFAVTETSATACQLAKLTFHYTGAVIGENEYISALVESTDGEPLCYGRITRPSAETGTFTVTVPSLLSFGDYTLKLFSEQYNGDFNTDYASAFSEVALKVCYTLTLDPNYEGAEPTEYVGVTQMELPALTREGYTFVGWSEKNTANETPHIGYPIYRAGDTVELNWNSTLRTGDKTLYAQWAGPGTSFIGDNLPVDGGYVYVNGIRWRVIGRGAGSELLISADAMGDAITRDEANAYLTEIYNAFSTQEQAAVLATSKTETDGYKISNSYTLLPTDLNGEKLFLPSALEATVYFRDNDDRKPGYYHLRSVSDIMHNGTVQNDGFIWSMGQSGHSKTRPMFQFDTTKVLFTSAAEGGKVGSGVLTPIGDETEADKKLTLLDEDRAFAVTETAATQSQGKSVVLHYTGAVTGDNEYVSALLANADGDLLYYGRLAQPESASGTVTVTVPAGLTDGAYTLKLFNEQYNGDYNTDIAGAFADVSLTVDQSFVCPHEEKTYFDNGNGTHTPTCAYCSEALASEAHRLGEDYAVTADGHNGVCPDCGADVFTDHDENGEQSVVNGTCSEQGSVTYTCSVCGNEMRTAYTGKVSDNHVNTESASETFSTCVTPGYTAGVFCSDCETWISGHEEKPLAEHSWQETERVNANCRDEGYVDYVCAVENCGKTKREVLEIDPDAHTFGIRIHPATCTEQGYTSYTCVFCRYGYNTDEQPALGHRWSAPVWTWAGTSATATFTCANGDHPETVTAAVSSETVLEPTDTEAGRKRYTATVTFEGTAYTDTVEKEIPALNEGLCKWCGERHEGFFGKILGFFHSVAYFFAHLFGKR